jgi:hypothetical protein
MRAAPGGRPLVAPPAAVRGMAALHARYGILPWAETVGPAEALARFGHAVSRSLAEDIARAADELAQDSGMRAVFGRPGGGFVQEGDQIEQLELAAALSQIRQRGAGAIFGPIGVSLLMAQVGPDGFFICIGAVHAAIGVFALYRMVRRAPLPLEEQGASVPVSSTVSAPTATLPVDAIRDQMDRDLAAMAGGPLRRR